MSGYTLDSASKFSEEIKSKLDSLRKDAEASVKDSLLADKNKEDES